MADSTKQPSAQDISKDIAPDGTIIGQTGSSQSPPGQTAHSQDQHVEQPEQSDEQPTEQPTEQPHVDASTEKEFSIEDFKNVLKPSEANHEEKKDDKKVAAEPVASVDKGKQDARDYSDIDEADKPLFVKMSNESFAKLVPIYKEFKKLKPEYEATKALNEQLKKGIVPIPDSYFEHENAFVLTPEFTKASENVNAAQVVYQHWQTQLSKIRGGEETTYTKLHIDPQTGQFYESAPLPIDKNTEAYVTNVVDGARQQLSEKQYAIRQIADTHKSKHQEAIGWFANLDKSEIFKDFQDPNSQLHPVVKDTINKFPASFRHSPVTKYLVQSMIMNAKLSAVIAKMVAGQKNGSGTPNGAPIQRQGPSSAEIAGEGSKGTGKPSDEITFEMFQRRKEGLPV